MNRQELNKFYAPVQRLFAEAERLLQSIPDRNDAAGVRYSYLESLRLCIKAHLSLDVLARLGAWVEDPAILNEPNKRCMELLKRLEDFQGALQGVDPDLVHMQTYPLLADELGKEFVFPPLPQQPPPLQMLQNQQQQQQQQRQPDSQVQILKRQPPAKSFESIKDPKQIERLISQALDDGDDALVQTLLQHQEKLRPSRDHHPQQQNQQQQQQLQQPLPLPQVRQIPRKPKPVVVPPRAVPKPASDARRSKDAEQKKLPVRRHSSGSLRDAQEQQQQPKHAAQPGMESVEWRKLEQKRREHRQAEAQQFAPVLQQMAEVLGQRDDDLFLHVLSNRNYQREQAMDVLLGADLL